MNDSFSLVSCRAGATGFSWLVNTFTNIISNYESSLFKHISNMSQFWVFFFFFFRIYQLLYTGLLHWLARFYVLGRLNTVLLFLKLISFSSFLTFNLFVFGRNSIILCLHLDLSCLATWNIIWIYPVLQHELLLNYSAPNISNFCRSSNFCIFSTVSQTNLLHWTFHGFLSCFESVVCGCFL